MTPQENASENSRTFKNMRDHAILSTLALWKLGRRMLNDGPYIGGGYPPTDEPPETALDLYMQAQHLGGFD